MTTAVRTHEVTLRKKKKKMRKKAGHVPQERATAQDLFEEGQQALERDDIERAHHCLRRAAQLAPEDVAILEALGSFLAEVGRMEDAAIVLRRAIQLAPDEGFEKYMYLGQIVEGEEAHAAMQRGAAILERTVQQLEVEGRLEDRMEAARQLAQAWCALAEHSMNEAENLASVATECELLLNKARAMDPASPEPLQALASLRSEQDRGEEALTLLRDSIRIWAPNLARAWEDDMDVDDGKHAEAGPGSHDSGDDDDEDDEEEDDEGLPSYEFRFETAKLLIELDATNEAAVYVLEGLLAEKDDLPDVYYMLALALSSCGDFEEALKIVEEGEAVLAKLDTVDGDNAKDAFNEIKEKIRELRAVPEHIP